MEVTQSSLSSVPSLLFIFLPIAGGLELGDLKGPFQPKLLYDSTQNEKDVLLSSNVDLSFSPFLNLCSLCAFDSIPFLVF